MHAILFAAALLAGQPEPQPYPAPPISGTDIRTGTPITEAHITGTLAVVHFWNPYCLASELEGESIRKFAEENEDIAVIGIVGPDYSDEEVNAFVERHGWRFSLIRDTVIREVRHYSASGTAYEFKVGRTAFAYDEGMVYPTSFLVDAEGKIVGKIVNYTDWQSSEMQDVLKHLRNGKLRWYERYYRRLK